MRKKENYRYLNISEAARYAEVSRSTIEAWLAEGLLSFEDLPSRGNGTKRFRRIRRDDIDAFLESHYISECPTVEVEMHESKSANDENYSSDKSLLAGGWDGQVRRVV